MVREIGSEFELPSSRGKNESSKKLCLPGDVCFSFSGRSALEYVLKDADAYGKAMLPSYCCDSMIEPFRRRGIEVGFYQVEFDGRLKIRYDEIPGDCTLLLVCGYFGFCIPEVPQDVVESIHEKGGVVIEDITHSLLSANVCHPWCDYAIASIRKWLPLLSGGIAVKVHGRFASRPEFDVPTDYTELKLEAMRQKRAYVDAGHVGDKQSFLELYRRANAWLRENYSNRRIDRESLEMLNHADFGEIAEARKRNARALYQGLTECSGIRFLFDQNQMDCPLFVPIVVAPSRRDKLRKTLSEASIYCPVHWPKPEDRCDSNLYDCELSLVCDQRYSEEDMERVACVVQGAFSSIG